MAYHGIAHAVWRQFSTAESRKASGASAGDRGSEATVEGFVFKTLLIGTILAVALKLGPHIGMPSISADAIHLTALDERCQTSLAARELVCWSFLAPHWP